MVVNISTQETHKPHTSHALERLPLNQSNYLLRAPVNTRTRAAEQSVFVDQWSGEFAY